MTPETFGNWRMYLQETGPRMSDVQLEACARLTAVLLCGEQSAIQIFAAEVERGRAPPQALAALRSIERDEQLHEQALRLFCEYLPTPDDGHVLKRRAQRFFAGLGRIDDVARHFGQISLLDSVVCKIMWHVENSSIDRVSALRWIASQIKKDEARHVSVSRNYAASLGLTLKKRYEDREVITGGLLDMLEPLGDSFETIGVNSERLFAQIRRGGKL